MAERTSWFFSLFPTVRAQEAAEEEDLVDPHTVLKEKCGEKAEAKKLYEKYLECNDRVNGRSKTTETCVEELFDYLHVVDHCVAHSLWSKLK